MYASTNLFTRPDTFFGVCQGLSEDLWIPADLFRAAFAALLFWNPMAAVAAYAGTGLVVAGTRFVFPNPKARKAVEAAAPAEEVAPEMEPEIAMAA